MLAPQQPLEGAFANLNGLPARPNVRYLGDPKWLGVSDRVGRSLMTQTESGAQLCGLHVKD